MYNIPFDQYQRYKMAEIIVNKLRSNTALKILEVGANEHQNLEEFLPNDEILYLDIQLPEHLKNNPKYIQGDATDLHFDDESFDIIIALDVYEHIPANLREDFIKELTRVGKEVIISAPIEDDNTNIISDYENRVNSFYRMLAGEGYKWLEEHIANGLPKLGETEAILKSTGKNYFIFNHGNLDIWESMWKIHFLNAKMGGSYDFYREEADKFYNKYIFNSDFSSKSYRRFVVVSDKVIDISNNTKEVISTKNHIESILQDFRTEYISFKEEIKNNNNPIENDFLQVYIDKGKGFNEEDSIKVSLDQNKITIPIKTDLKNSVIRMDPCNEKCIFKLESLQIYNDDHKVEWEISNTNGQRYSKNFFYFKDEDPQIYLDIKEQSVDHIYIEYILHKGLDNIDNLYWFVEMQKINEGLNAKINEIEEYKIELENLKEEKKNIELKFEESVDNLNEEKENLHKTLIAKEEKIELYEKEIGNCKKELLNINNENGSLKRSLKEKEEKIVSCEKEIQNNMQQISELTSNKEQLEQSCCNKDKELQEIKSTKIWRLRSFLKRGAK